MGAPGESVHNHPQPQAAEKEQEVGLETVTIRSPIPGTAVQGWLFPSRGPSRSPGVGLKASLPHRAPAQAVSHSRRDARWDASPGGLWGEMRSAAEVSSDGKLFRKIKEQVGNRAAKQTVQETIALQIGFQISPSDARSTVLRPSDAHGFFFFPFPYTCWEEAQAVCSLLPFLFQDVCWSLKQDVMGQALQVSLDKTFSSVMILAPAAGRGRRDFRGRGAARSVPSSPRRCPRC